MGEKRKNNPNWEPITTNGHQTYRKRDKGAEERAQAMRASSFAYDDDTSDAERDAYVEGIEDEFDKFAEAYGLEDVPLDFSDTMSFSNNERGYCTLWDVRDSVTNSADTYFEPGADNMSLKDILEDEGWRVDYNFAHGDPVVDRAQKDKLSTITGSYLDSPSASVELADMVDGGDEDMQEAVALWRETGRCVTDDEVDEAKSDIVREATDIYDVSDAAAQAARIHFRGQDADQDEWDDFEIEFGDTDNISEYVEANCESYMDDYGEVDMDEAVAGYARDKYGIDLW